jgi:hypothetical protein
VRPAAWLAAALLLAQAPTALAISPQTLSDPIGDNCRDYGVAYGSLCGPDVSQVVFSAPGDGNLHVDITYVSLPPSPKPEMPDQKPEFAELGIYSLSATTADLYGAPNAYRVAQTSPGEWTLQSMSTFTMVGTVTANVRPMGLELIVPLTVLGDAASHKYAVNAGSPGESIPMHPELVPNTGLFEFAPEPPAIAVESTTLTGSTAIKGLASIRARQSGRDLAGSLVLGAAGDLTIDALARVGSKRRSIGKFRKAGAKAGDLSFRIRVTPSVRRRLAGRRAQVTLRFTLKPATGSALTQNKNVSLRVLR